MIFLEWGKNSESMAKHREIPLGTGRGGRERGDWEHWTLELLPEAGTAE